MKPIRLTLLTFFLTFFLLVSFANALPVNMKYASLTVVVKSNQNGMPIGGSKVTIRGEKNHNCAGCRWQFYCQIELITDGQGKATARGYDLTKSSSGGKTTVYKSVTHKFHISATASGFSPSQATTILDWNNPNSVAYLYLSPK